MIKTYFLPGKGDTGVVDPAGDAGGVSLRVLSGFTIIILRVTLIAGSSTAVFVTGGDSASERVNEFVQFEYRRLHFWIQIFCEKN